MPFPSSRTTSSRGPADESMFTILTVCTGNVCRSPQLEILLRQQLHSQMGEGFAARLRISSAGTLARDGTGMEPNAQSEGVRLGLDPVEIEHHRARRLRSEHLEAADLVLALDRGHRADAVGLAPTTMRRAFTLLEFARIVHHLVDPIPGVDSVSLPPLDHRGANAFLRGVVDAAASMRGVLPPPSRQPDVEDPMGRGAETFRRSADVIGEATRLLVRDLHILAWNR